MSGASPWSSRAVFRRYNSAVSEVDPSLIPRPLAEAERRDGTGPKADNSIVSSQTEDRVIDLDEILALTVAVLELSYFSSEKLTSMLFISKLMRI